VNIHDFVVDGLFLGFELGERFLLGRRKNLGLALRPTPGGLASTCLRYAASRSIRTALGIASNFVMAVSNR
jgi:hypothetical protein